MLRKAFAPLLLGALTFGSQAYGAERLHMHTSSGSFLHVQYTSKREFIDGLRHHPHSLKALARHFHVSSDEFLSYAENNLRIGRLSASGRYEVWGLSRNGHSFMTHARYKAGMPTWETKGGTPVLRWLCSNPLVAELPMKQTPPPVVVPPPPPPPAPVVTPPPPPPPAPPVEVAPPPPPPPAPPVEVAPPPPPPAPPVVVTTPPPPPPAPEKPVMMRTEPKYNPWSIWFGADTWQLFRIDKVDTYFTLGASYDPIRWGKHFTVGLYADTAGWMNDHPSYEYYGGGVEARGYLYGLDKNVGINPYAGVGYGIYWAQIVEANKESRTMLAPRFTLGFDVNHRYFLEGSYDAFGNHFGRDLGRFGAEIGIRF